MISIIASFRLIIESVCTNVVKLFLCDFLARKLQIVFFGATTPKCSNTQADETALGGLID
jgi:hypothetical protein